MKIVNETIKLCNTQTNYHQYEFCSQTETQYTIFGNNSIPFPATQVTEIKSGDTCYPNNRKHITRKTQEKEEKEVLCLIKFRQITVSEECCLFSQVA